MAKKVSDIYLWYTCIQAQIRSKSQIVVSASYLP